MVERVAGCQGVEAVVEVEGLIITDKVQSGMW